ncbi:hypothetical protein [Ottowia sp.]|uniref:hypothetical protein n=1 Tax=Ottowia sp. TaxID=1898956 RepID=UPI0025D01703|nr:hypothetical protein [Ottowia sp.]MBK6745653.1 hypothetical protein [Ottowia sp.]
MPPIRSFGNAALSFITSSAPPSLNTRTPTNGYTAIHGGRCESLPDKPERRYFFESYMPQHLSIIRVVVHDADGRGVRRRGVEPEGPRVPPEFMLATCSASSAASTDVYLVRDFNLGSLYSLFALLSTASPVFGAAVGAQRGHWAACPAAR